jgi:hypothetical protein
MREVLYYPNFYIENEKWLKFALLYLGEVVTIMPENMGNIELSENQELVLRKTNLFSAHSPTSEEIEDAALNIGDTIGRITMNPLLQNRANGWRDLERESMEIYSGKMAYKLQEMLLEKEWAQETERGLIINNDLATEYMTLLANVISNRRDIQTISDKKSVIRYGELNKIVRTDFRNNNLKTLEDSIEIYLPRNIDETPIERIIEFRNDPVNQRNLNEFHDAMAVVNRMGEMTSEYDIIEAKKRLIDAKKQYKSNLRNSFAVTGASILGIYQLIDGDASSLDFLKEVLGMSVIAGAKVAYGQVNGYTNASKAVSYLTDVEKLNRFNGYRTRAW